MVNLISKVITVLVVVLLFCLVGMAVGYCFNEAVDVISRSMEPK